MPQSIAMLSDDLVADQILERLGTGSYFNNLHYLNFYALNTTRITGLNGQGKRI